uniref:Uncharacterized protein n=1 Tax=Heterorhabditis bacteriophora TaxID=37862 RepID=A0A1I7X7U7_HETBA
MFSHSPLIPFALVTDTLEIFARESLPVKELLRSYPSDEFGNKEEAETARTSGNRADPTLRFHPPLPFEKRLENIPGSVLAESLPLEVAATDQNCLSDKTDKDTEVMGMLSEFYEKILRKLRIEKKDSSSGPQSLRRKRLLTTKELKERNRNFRISSVVVRPRSNTEIVIERRRYSRSNALVNTELLVFSAFYWLVYITELRLFNSNGITNRDTRRRLKAQNMELMPPISNNYLQASHKKNELSNCTQLAERKRSRSDSAPSLPIIISGKAETGPTHLSLVSTGSILAPTYRSRTASIKQPTIIRVTLE